MIGSDDLKKTICRVGAATAFLAHDAARFLTGETLYRDRGYPIMD